MRNVLIANVCNMKMAKKYDNNSLYFLEGNQDTGDCLISKIYIILLHATKKKQIIKLF